MRLALVLALASFGARASSVSDEVNVSSTQSTESSPRSGTVGNSVNASFDLSDQWTFSAGLLLTHAGSIAAANAADFGTSGNTFTLVTGALDFNVNDSVTVGISGEGSPATSSTTGVPVSVITSRRRFYLDVASRSTEWGMGVDASYDTTGDSNLEWAFDLGVKYSSTDATQNVTSVNILENGTVTPYTPRELRQDCLSGTLTCPKRVTSALRNVPAQIDSFKLSPGVTATAWRDTDVSLSGDYYLYAKDEVAYATLVMRNLLGNGLPMAPLRFLVRPEITHRWGGFSARVWAQAGKYVEGEGDTTAGLGLKLQYKFTREFRGWVTVTGQRDVDASGAISRSSSLAGGAAYRW